MKKTENVDAVRNELTARGLGAQFDEETTWTKLLTLLKKTKETRDISHHVPLMIRLNGYPFITKIP